MNSIPLIPSTTSVHTVNNEDLLVRENRIMLTTQIEIQDGSLDVEGALEII